MSKVKIIFALGVWIAVLPYLGFPYSLKNTLFSITGLGLIYIGYVLYQNYKAGESKEKKFDNFSENSNFIENEAKPETAADLNKEEIKP
jgi:hypothetical protein